jgi:phenylacetate-CoA ligase
VEYWEKNIETASESELEALRLQRLRETIERASKSEFYGKKFSKEKYTNPESTADISAYPFTTKDDLRAYFPYGFLTVPLSEVVRLHSSSGTTGNPTVVFHTIDDIESWKNTMARCMFMAGARKHDVFQNMMGYGLFTGGLGFHYGAEKLGMLTIPIGPGNSKRQVWFMQQFKSTVLHILPSYALRLAEVIEEMSVDRKSELSIRLAFIGAEPHTEEIRRKIEQSLDITAFNSYGLSEMQGPGVAFECEEKNGLHLWEDQFLMEIVDPKTLEPVPDGEEGELVLTTLARRAMPLVRYRTRDLTRILPGPCACGRTHRRIDRIKGRSDDMLIINGVNLFPMQIEAVLMKIPEVGSNYVIEVHKKNFMDKIVLKVEVTESNFPGTLADMNHLEEKITRELAAELLVTPEVKLVEESSLPVSEGKVKRVYDLRGSETDQGGMPK